MNGIERSVAARGLTDTNISDFSDSKAMPLLRGIPREKRERNKIRMSIPKFPVRRHGRGSKRKEKRNDEIHDADDPEGLRDGAAGHHARSLANHRDDEVQRIPPEGRGIACAGWSSSPFHGRPRVVRGRETTSHGWALPRGERGGGRLLDDPGH